ncbi:histone H2A deubiquitinase MYSM1 isoform X1 [Conger conger]|uniref:histone H2A deubiquitinase MYSM1 isoform X1 n=1 Tax=Conger conger TaxID=82655 RepID=UPI002A59AFA9|nr:histone H2A deubiquitinase MYSM1 isoform X1 [Conger conger]
MTVNPAANMADELDIVDIEGDETEVNMRDNMEGGILQDQQYLQSAWSTNSGILPWTLDSSISDENREVIENMLLEEQYYFAGKELPKSMWTGDKQKVKSAMSYRSPVKPAGAPVRWAQEEKDLFEKGLAQFGRRWTKIAKLIGSRTVLQVKSYARQYLKNKAKADVPMPTVPTDCQASLNGVPPGAECASDRSAGAPITVLSNAVRIERLSDDEDVDITDDLSNDAPLLGIKMEPCEERPSEELDTKGEPSQSPPSPSTASSSQPLKQPCCEDSNADSSCPVWAECHSALGEEGSLQLCKSGSPGGGSQYESEDTEGAVLSEREVGLEEELEEGEEEELKAPEQEVYLDTCAVTEEEKQAISEFFEGRSSKTPERYLKIRNYILDQWEKSKPRYLNKTSVRPGLKNCGDVNCIGRIHTYLELIGAINFNCEQAIYNRPRVVDRSRVKEGRDTLEAFQMAQRLQSMRTRKRRVRDVWGNWCDPKDLEGQTFEHLSAEDLARRREESRKRHKPCKIPRQKGSFDPFQLIPCQAFGDQKKEPFQVLVCAEALVVMDMHAHVSMAEVIGLLGGAYSEEEKVLKICAAEPCNSLSTGLQCEMDPVSQTQASEVLASHGYSVVGWYHSHPAFDPNPSLRDIDTQAKYQSYFSRGGAPFIGMIISPYNPANTSPLSQTTCLVVSEEEGPTGSHKLPFRFLIQQSCEEPDWAQVLRRAQWVVHKYRLSHGSVPMDRLFRRDSHLTCLEKMLASLRKFLELLSDNVVNTFLTQMETLFLSEFTAEKRGSQDEGDASSTLPAVISSLGFSSVQPPEYEGIATGQTVSMEGGPAVSLQIEEASPDQPVIEEAETGYTVLLDSLQMERESTVQPDNLVQTP